MAGKHTPTPWQQHDNAEYYGPKYSATVWGPEGPGYGLVADCRQTIPSVSLANARLIVRAVNHHESLVAIVRELTFDATGDSTGDMIRFGQACDRARILLATLDAEPR